MADRDGFGSASGRDGFERLGERLDQSGRITATFEAELSRLAQVMSQTGREVTTLSSGFGGGLRKAFEGVVFDGMKLLDLAGPAEVFAEANRFGANYRLVVASVDGQDVATSIGSPFSVTAVSFILVVFDAAKSLSISSKRLLRVRSLKFSSADSGAITHLPA